MLIGQLAEHTSLSTKTLRFYERAGVMPPAARASNGYRCYGDDAVERIRFIRAAQAAGLTLAEVRDVIAMRDDGVAPCEHVIGLLGSKATSVKARIAELVALDVELTRLIDRAKALDPSACGPSSICQVLS